MRNIDFKLGFPIHRSKLTELIFRHPEYNLRPDLNNFMGVRISVPLPSIDNLEIKKTYADR